MAKVIDKHKVAESQAIADPIIHALSDFRIENDAFPERLEELVPDYLKELPRPSVGFLNKQSFFYSRYENEDQFFIGFRCPAWMISHYSSEGDEWVVDD